MGDFNNKNGKGKTTYELFYGTSRTGHKEHKRKSIQYIPRRISTSSTTNNFFLLSPLRSGPVIWQFEIKIKENKKKEISDNMEYKKKLK